MPKARTWVITSCGLPALIYISDLFRYYTSITSQNQSVNALPQSVSLLNLSVTHLNSLADHLRWSVITKLFKKMCLNGFEIKFAVKKRVQMNTLFCLQCNKELLVFFGNRHVFKFG